VAITRAAKAVGCQPSEWTVAVTEQRDETSAQNYHASGAPMLRQDARCG